MLQLVNEVFGIKIQGFFHYMKQSKLKYLIRKKVLEHFYVCKLLVKRK